MENASYNKKCGGLIMAVTEQDIRTELTKVMNTFPTFLDKQNADHIICFSYIKECVRCFRKCISVNFLDETSLESISIDYYSYMNCIYSTDKTLFSSCGKYITIILDNLRNILHKHEMYESLKNIKFVVEIIEEEVKNKYKNKK